MTGKSKKKKVFCSCHWSDLTMEVIPFAQNGSATFGCVPRLDGNGGGLGYCWPFGEVKIMVRE